MIDFNVENVELPELDFPLIEKWIDKIASNHGKITGKISYIFTDDKNILNINRQFLNHDFYTDIITFDYSRKRLISGDIYVSLDTVASNAGLLDVKYLDELLRVIIHGILHLCGIDDKGPGEREIMEKQENEALMIYAEMSK